MIEFKGLGLVDMMEGEYENSEKSIRLKSEFSWFLGDEFRALRDGFTPDYLSSNKSNENDSKLLQEKTPLSSFIPANSQTEQEQQEKKEEEKVEIARRHIIPKQMDAHGITARNVALSRSALKAIILQYTHESGLRQFEREIATICRKVARRFAEGDDRVVRRLSGDAVFISGTWSE